MRFRHQFVVMLLFLVFGLGSAAVIFFAGAQSADEDVVDVLETRAAAAALELRTELRRALDVGMTLEEIRGLPVYLEETAQSDDDIRFLAITNAEFKRIFYGGIGRRRLDPLLLAPNFQVLGQNLAKGEVERAFVGEFSISVTPIGARENRFGYVVVAVQAKQVREALLETLVDLWPLILVGVLTLIELALLHVGRSLRGPWLHLQDAIGGVGREGRVSISTRYERHEFGGALRAHNRIAETLRDRFGHLYDQACDIRARGGGASDDDGRSTLTTQIERDFEQRWRVLELRSRPPEPADLQIIASVAFMLLAMLSIPVVALVGTVGLTAIALSALVGLVTAIAARRPFAFILLGLVLSCASVIHAQLHADFQLQINIEVLAHLRACLIGLGFGMLLGAVCTALRGSLDTTWLFVRAVLGGGAGWAFAWHMADATVVVDRLVVVLLASAFALLSTLLHSQSRNAIFKTSLNATAE